MPVGAYAGANVSNGNGVTTLFPYNFKILDQTHIEVKVGGVLKVLGADYTVTGVGLSGGGNVLMTAAPANGAVVQRARKVPYTRSVDYQNNGDFQENTVDSDFDLLEMQVQQLAADSVRSIKAPLSVTADQVVSDADWAARASKIIGFAADGVLTLFAAASAVTDALNVNYLAPWAGAISRTVKSWFTDRVSLFDFIPAAIQDQVSAGTYGGDVSAYVQSFLTYLATTNRRGYVPRGVYPIAAGLTLTGVTATKFGMSVLLDGEGGTPDGDKPGSIFKWAGTDNVANILLTLNGIYYFEANNIAFYGDYKVGQVIKVNNAGGGYAPSKWRHNGCLFQGAKDAALGGKVYYVTGATNCDQFRFQNCRFVGGGATPSDGYVSDNQNAILQDFSGSHFDQMRRAVWLNGGDINGASVNFTQSSETDLYLQIHNRIVLNGPWTEQSRKFIISDNREQFEPVVLNGLKCASFPWSWWKTNEAGRAQPANDYTQWIAIDWDRPAGLLLNGCKFVDPFNGAVTGAVAPTIAQVITARVPNSAAGRAVDVINSGSVSQNGTDSFTKDFMRMAATLAAMRLPRRKRYENFGNFSGVLAPQPHSYSTAEIILTGNITSFSPANVTGHEDEDEHTIVFTQDGVGGRTIAGIAGYQLTQGTFYLDPTPNAKTLITFRRNGANWVEVARCVPPLQGSAAYDPPNLADGAGATTTVAVTGAALGDFAEASFSLDLQGITVTAWVSAANTVSVRFQNESGGALDLANGTLRARVRKP